MKYEMRRVQVQAQSLERTPQIEGRMNKLKRKTQRAIVDILREKLAERSDGEDDFEESVVAVLK